MFMNDLKLNTGNECFFVNYTTTTTYLILSPLLLLFTEVSKVSELVCVFSIFEGNN